MKNTFTYDKNVDLGKWIISDKLQAVKKVAVDGDKFTYQSIEHVEFDDTIIFKLLTFCIDITSHISDGYALLHGYKQGVNTVISKYKEYTPQILAEIYSENNCYCEGSVLGRFSANLDDEELLKEFHKLIEAN